MINHPTSGIFKIYGLCVVTSGAPLWCPIKNGMMCNIYYQVDIFLFLCGAISTGVGVIAWTLGLRDILATTMCFNYRINAFERQVTQYFVWEDAWCCCSNGYLLHSFMCLSKLLHSAAFSLAFGSWKYHPTKLVFWSFMAPFGVGSVCVLGGGQQTLRHGNHWVDVMG